MSGCKIELMNRGYDFYNVDYLNLKNTGGILLLFLCKLLEFCDVIIIYNTLSINYILLLNAIIMT
ncbi:hypothetical protein RLOatenuis_5040 [Rickettsiales bacterium]|nr:hypothetical protein RLOatenuis_5040 [Rickettsiales bacterium]